MNWALPSSCEYMDLDTVYFQDLMQKKVRKIYTESLIKLYYRSSKDERDFKGSILSLRGSVRKVEDTLARLIKSNMNPECI